MKQIKVKGYAKKEFVADIMEIRISISTRGETPSIALNKGKRETERVLQLLVDIGLDLANISMINDEVSEPSRYDDEKTFHFEKDVSFKTNVNLEMIEKISSGIMDEEINATYTESFALMDHASAEKNVLQSALIDAKKKAEAIAETLGQKVVGIECAKCDDYNDEENEDSMVHKLCLCEGSGSSLASKLSPRTIQIDKSIDVAWIIE